MCKTAVPLANAKIAVFRLIFKDQPKLPLDMGELLFVALFGGKKEYVFYCKIYKITNFTKFF